MALTRAGLLAQGSIIYSPRLPIFETVTRDTYV